ncbi:toprim domain-containing protein [Chryseobacterium aquaticum]|uniref:DNA primase n=1 Tax=Chryseobacterium aquaticum subsp. greenlandense TaxID=345663 RepID=A0A101CLC8_9FLAO|nr:toprim domain-containing protein [Chryseobacterium aquaticum]KUJ58337.1 DNA primase [Chryseobacterium aquaticum subsp. greenlandense]
MNCEQIKQNVSIRTVMESYGLNPVKENKRTAFYFALDRQEKTASLSVDFIKNTAFDFGTGKTYDVISIVQAIDKCNVSTALEYLNKLDFSPKIDTVVETNDGFSYAVLKTIDVEHPALLEYLNSRGVLNCRSLVKEIHYTIEGKYYFAIAFFNNSGGIEVRNKYSKICLGPKDVTLIKNGNRQNNEIAVFEGFFDYLSFKAVKNDKFSSDIDYMVFNSTSMLLAGDEILKQYKKISLFLDNDKAGKTAVEQIRNMYQNVEDCSWLYRNYKDLNQWLMK